MTNNAQTPQTARPHIQRINRGKGHSYKIDGRPVPGVTTLINKGIAKPALQYWAARSVAEYVADAEPETLDHLRTLGRAGMVDALKGIPWNQRDTAALAGTTVHALAEKLIKGEQVEVPDEAAGHVDSAVRFLDDWRVSPVLTETVVASRRHRYAGTLDAVVDLPDGRRAIIDYKTARSGIFPETALQLAAYRYADVCIDPAGDEADMTLLGIDCGYAVWLRGDGYDVHPVRCDRAVFLTFLQVSAVARAVDEDMPTWVGEPEVWAAEQVAR